MTDRAEEMREKAAEQMDWRQVVLNGGPPCFHIETDERSGTVGEFCGRAQRWPGHDGGDIWPNHEFISLADLVRSLYLPESTPTRKGFEEFWATVTDSECEFEGFEGVAKRAYEAAIRSLPTEEK